MFFTLSSEISEMCTKPSLPLSKDTKAPKGFINCPASIEAGKKTSCELCSMCSGSGSKRGKNIYINAHGNTAKYVPVIA